MRINFNKAWIYALGLLLFQVPHALAQATLSCEERGIDPVETKKKGYTITDFEGHITKCTSETCCRLRELYARGLAPGDFNELTEITAFFYDPAILVTVLDEAGIHPVGPWPFLDLKYVGQGVVALAQKVGGFPRLHALIGSIAIYRKKEAPGGTCLKGSAACTFPLLSIEFFDLMFSGPRATEYSISISGTAVHEIAHAIDFNLFRLSFWTRDRIDPVFPSNIFPRGPHITDYALTPGNFEYWPEAVVDWVYGIKYKPGAGLKYEEKVREPLSLEQRAMLKSILVDWPLE